MENTPEKLKQRHENVLDLLKCTDHSIDFFKGDEGKEGEHERGEPYQNMQTNWPWKDPVEDCAALRFSRGIASMTENLNALLNITARQKCVLGFSLDSSTQETTIPMEETPEGLMTSLVKSRPTFMCSSGATSTSAEGPSPVQLNDAAAWKHMGEMELAFRRSLRKETELKRKLIETEVRDGLSYQKVVSEREELRRLLSETEDEIEDLKYAHEQKVRLLKEELDTHQDMTIRLQEAENARHLESAFASERISQYEREIMLLRRLLADSTDKECFRQREKESAEESGGTQIKSLEEALTAATRMNTVLLGNAEKRDMAHKNALKEIDNLGRRIVGLQDEVSCQKEAYEEKIEAMEAELVSLRPFVERANVAEKKLLEYAQRKHMTVNNEEEVKRLRVALRDANNLALTLKREYATLATSVQSIRRIGQDAYTQCDAIPRCDASVNTSGGADCLEHTSCIIGLTREVERLTSECVALRERLEALKQAHSIETDFLSAGLLQAESNRLAYLPQGSACAPRHEPRAMSDVATQTVLVDESVIVFPGQKIAETEKGCMDGLQPPIVVVLSPRVKDTHEDTESSSLHEISLAELNEKSFRSATEEPVTASVLWASLS
ncbi:hypothetical protein DQ04_00401040 [Trypanosoma grayi]|uniref:hypothetical protein n=1 Tax=Trypanosoma grayi TaxID=71804 RepID=UPI0004F48C96|nr:hypothetical protein DQ04_00401040 [Trypanosoma grayi]KEG14564.1 hypothetical protein DQ04_00401040 [Trypanosoma grayi]